MRSTVNSSDTKSILNAVTDDMRAGAPAGLANLAAAAGVPLLDIASTVLSTRAAMLGMQTGRGFAHHELRVRAPMPDGLDPEIDVWDGGTVPVWDGGVLTEPKYFSFFQDQLKLIKLFLKREIQRICFTCSKLPE